MSTKQHYYLHQKNIYYRFREKLYKTVRLIYQFIRQV